MHREILEKRNLPSLLTFNNGTPVSTADDWRKRRKELLEALSSEIYGYTPAAPADLHWQEGKTVHTFGGKATQTEVTLSFSCECGDFSFPCQLLLPAGAKNIPMFVNISFQSEVPCKYLPAEEIIDHGFGIATFDYQAVTSDGPEWDGLAACYARDSLSGWGKIGIWGFAASRVMDYLEHRSEIDLSRVCVCGHSRLGKTALWCAAQDERFSMVVSNESGCSGAAISRGKVGESIRDITQRFPYWFCGKYQQWANREYEAPVDQHMLLSLIAPRKLYVSSAAEDQWADPESEFLCCAAADEVWKLLRVPGLICLQEKAELNVPLNDGGICYHVRSGEHFFSRTDWLYHMQCREKFNV